MNRRALAVVPMGLFFLVTTVFLAWGSMQRPRLLILHSYSTDYVWTRQVNKGLDRVLKDKRWFSVRYHYMKTKQFSGKKAKERAAIAARNAIDEFAPAVLLAIDDYAQKLVAKDFVNDPNIKIVYAGVNGKIEPYGYPGAHNVTGILERKPVGALRDVIALIASVGRDGEDFEQSPPRVVALFDPALSGKQDAETLRGEDWSPHAYQGELVAVDYVQWQELVLGLADRVDFLLVGGYRKLPRSPTDATYVPPKELMRWTELNSPVPVIGMNAFNTSDGAMLSVGVSPYEQGETAASMALAILKGTEPSAIPGRESQQHVIAMRGSAMRRRGLELPHIYEAFARATNSYFE